MLFVGPIEEDSAWSTQGIGGVYRFLNRVWTLTQEYLEAEKSENPIASDSSRERELAALQHRTTKKVTTDIHRMSFNTAIAAMMEYTNELYKLKTDGFSEKTWHEALSVLAQLIAPFAPHMAAELWQQLGHDNSLDTAKWPTWDESLTVSETMTIVVQVNGKVRAKLSLAKDSTKEQAIEAALADENVQKFVADQKPAKTIYVPGRLVNIVVNLS